ncbi:MAG: PAS domain S-box protein [Melioribacteraceae bacterium]|nr:PAS domain S-box protein [Melioribacteraceae bacterium]
MEDEVEVGNEKSFSDLELITRAIFEISEAVETTKDLEDLYCQVHTIINQYIPAQSFYIALYNPDDKSITFPYYVDNLDSPAKVSQLDNTTISVTNYAMEKDNPLLITSKMLGDLIESGEVVKPASSLSQWLGVPLKTLDNNKIGLLAVQNFDKNYKFTDEHKHFLNFISTQIALAIQHKQYVAKIRSEEKKFRFLYQKNPLMLFIIDEDGKIIDANEKATIDLEYELHEVIGKNVSEVFHPEDKEQVRINIKKCLENREETHKWELRKISKSGKVVWVRETASTLDYTSGQTQLLISCENITDQKNSELKLKESENQYRLLTDNIDEMIIMHDTEGNILSQTKPLSL